jgi:hypothetical protein
VANLHTAYIKSMMDSTDIDKRYQHIVETLETAYRCLEDLMDDPIFLDTIHGEQELALDQSLELIDGIKYSFVPEYLLPEYHDRDRFDPADVS